MSGVNKVILIGRLGQDPEMKFNQQGGAIANVSMATSEKWKDKNSGEQKEKTEWHRVVFFGKIAEIVGQYVKKGSNIYIEGKLQTRKWQDQSGADRYSTEVVVDGFNGVLQMLDGAPANNQQQAPQKQQKPQQQAPQQQQQPQTPPNYQQAGAPQQIPQQPRQQQPQQQQQPAAGPDAFNDNIPF